MIEKIKCIACENLILSETAKANGGLCAVCKKAIKRRRPIPKTPDALLALDHESPYSWSELADRLYGMMSEFVTHPRDLYQFDRPVMAFYASAHSNWLVREGGFAMAAYNGPEWIPYGAIAFRELGKPLISDVLLEAAKMIPEELALQDSLNLIHNPTKDALARYLDVSPIQRLNRLFIASDWEIGPQTMRYVRENKSAFQPRGSRRGAK